MYVHVYGACTLCPCACMWLRVVCMCMHRTHVLCVLVHVCVHMHVCDHMCYVCAYGFCTLGASAQPLPGDKGLIEGLCPPAALQSCRGPLPGIFFQKEFPCCDNSAPGERFTWTRRVPQEYQLGVCQQGRRFRDGVQWLGSQGPHPPWESLLTSPGPERTRVGALVST